MPQRGILTIVSTSSSTVNMDNPDRLRDPFDLQSGEYLGSITLGCSKNPTP